MTSPPVGVPVGGSDQARAALGRPLTGSVDIPAASVRPR